MVDEFVEGDTGSVLEITCKDQDGAAIDLSGSTVELLWRDTAGVLQTRTMTRDPDQVTNKGKATYLFLTAELFYPRMEAEVKLTDGGPHILTSLDKLEWSVRKRI